MDCIEVRRSETGSFEIPGAGEPEDWSEVRAAMIEVEQFNSLKGWPPWSRVFRAVDRDGRERWYFVRSIAETIAHQFGDDGQCFELPDGTPFSQVVAEHRATRDVRDGGDSIRHEFADGSAIVETQGGWDLGHPFPVTCHCWPAAYRDGHDDECGYEYERENELEAERENELEAERENELEAERENELDGREAP